MNPEQYILALAARARAETPPRISVAHKVIQDLRAMQDSKTAALSRPMMWVAVLSSATAVPAAVLALIVYYATADPLVEITRAVSWVIQ